MNLKKLHSILAALLLGLCFSLSGYSQTSTQSDSAGKMVASIEVPKGLASENVQRAILESLIHRHWQVKDKTENAIVAYYGNSRNEATLTIKFDTNEIDIYCVGHTRKEGELPMGWINGLKKIIGEYLGREVAKK